MFLSTQTTGTDDSPQGERKPFHKEKESSNVEGQETRERMAGDTDIGTD